MTMQKRICYLGILMILCLYITACASKNNLPEEKGVLWESFSKEESNNVDIYEKGYNLPVNETEKEEARDDCEKMMEKISTIYKACNKDATGNVVFSDTTALEMLNVLEKEGLPVYYYNNMGMYNYVKMENFMNESLIGKKGSIVFYEINSQGGIARNKFIFDGKSLYLLYTNCTWDEDNGAVINETFHNRVNQWKYTKKGWLCYELCVPQPPEVTEIVDSSCMVRVKQIKKEYREIAEKYLIPVGYQGNNLFSSNWNQNNLEKLDYNGLYQAFYSVAYQKKLDYTKYPNGISEKDFEKILMKYLPVSSEQLKKWAVYDGKSGKYMYARLGCFNYTPDNFWTSTPEITKIKKNKDGTTTITIDAVCERMGSDKVITHNLTVRFLKNDGIEYLENQILGDGLQKIPKYQYRVK